MRTLPPDYVTGFAEAAGSFTFNRSAGQLTMVFAIRSRSANRELLVDLQRFFGGAGRIYDTSTGGTGPVRRNACLYRVNRPRELLRIVAHFDAHPLRGDKARAYGLWREMVHLRAAHTGSRPPGALDELARQLSAARNTRTEDRSP